MKKHFGFTLAEVLITLTIIGVVAAVTIPLLVKKYQKLVVETKIKQSYSMLQQAIKLSEVDNGDMSNWIYPTAMNRASNLNFVNNYIIPYLKTVKYCDKNFYTIEKACTGYMVSQYAAEYVLANGVIASFYGQDNSKIISVFITIKRNNALSEVNINEASYMYDNIGKEVFYFRINDGVVYPYGWTPNLTRENIKQGYSWQTLPNQNINIACRKNKGNNKYYRYACTALLYLDGWKIKDDYPW